MTPFEEHFYEQSQVHRCKFWATLCIFWQTEQAVQHLMLQKYKPKNKSSTAAQRSCEHKQQQDRHCQVRYHILRLHKTTKVPNMKSKFTMTLTDLAANRSTQPSLFFFWRFSSLSTRFPSDAGKWQQPPG